LLAGLLYLGSGAGLTVLRVVRDRGWRSPGIASGEWLWLLGAIFFGGIVGPLLLMRALTQTPATTASLLLNLEGVFTALLAWFVFRENADRRIVLGMALIVAGGAVLAWPSAWSAGGALGASLVAFACLAWAIDNNLTRKVAASDSLFIAGMKGWVAGAVNVGIAFATGASVPNAPILGEALVVGFLGYGASLVLFVIALRGLGSARTGAYFSIAPFFGAAVAILAFGEPTTTGFWIAAAFMAIGVWLHLTERHEHEHTHAALSHVHSHRHDLHHQHQHDFPWDGSEPHTHTHEHDPATHTHPHFPDIHHQHRH
jgi:drug/metabolite transporter (DMT)-like permease